MKVNAPVGYYVRWMRRGRGLRQVELARRLRTSQSAISRMENASDLTVCTLLRVASALGCRLELELVRVDRIEP